MKRAPLKRASRSQMAFERAYRALRRTILERDGHRCRACGWSFQLILQTHHVVKRSRDKKLRLDPDNLVTLCCPCHARTDASYAAGRLVVKALGGGKFDFQLVTKASKWTPEPAA